MSAETNKAAIRQGLEAWNLGDDAFARWADQFVSSTVEIEVPVLTMSGIKLFLGYFKSIRDAFPDGHVTGKEMVAEGDTVISTYTFTGTNTGTLLSRPIVTGRGTTFTTVDVYHFSDGKIVDFWQTYDRLAMLGQLDALAAATMVVP